MNGKIMNNPRALVTGASSGIGAAFSERLARDHYDLVIVARRRERLEELAQSIRKNKNVAVEVIVADLTRPEELHNLERQIAEDLALELLINNAGFGDYNPFIMVDPDRAEEMISLQVAAVTRLMRAALPNMVARGRGAIINVSSRLAFSAKLPSPPLPKCAIYGATKAYVKVLTQMVHKELEGTGVRVQALCPGLVQTEFHEKVGIDSKKFPAGMVMKPGDVVEASLAGLAAGEVVCIPTLDDPGLFTQIDEGERQVWERSTGSALAKRYL